MTNQLTSDQDDYYEQKAIQRDKGLRVIAYGLAILLVIAGFCFLLGV